MEGGVKFENQDLIKDRCTFVTDRGEVGTADGGNMAIKELQCKGIVERCCI